MKTKKLKKYGLAFQVIMILNILLIYLAIIILDIGIEIFL